MLEVHHPTTPIPGSCLPHIRALLLDDDAFDRKRIRRFTEQSGLTVLIEEAQSISALIEKLDSDQFDLVLIDYQLADGDGLQAIELVREHQTNSGAATIMVTGRGQTDVAVSAFRKGCNDFIQKDLMTPAIIRDVVIGAMEQADEQLAQSTAAADDMHAALRAAMNGDVMRDAIQSVLLENMAPQQGRVFGPDDPRFDDQFLNGFLNEDEFHFKN